MKILNLVQGSPEWHTARATRFTASEAPAMMGASKYQTRTALLNAKKSGYSPTVSADQQRLFDRGHAAEEAARPIVEGMINEELYPITATDDAGRLLASFDGITMSDDVIFEHKLYSKSLAEQVRAGGLEPHYYWQLEQQLLVSGAEFVHFVVSDGTRDKFETMRYYPVAGRAEALIAGWAQFERDLETHVPTPDVAPAAIGRAPDALPALRIELTGLVTASNLNEFRDHAIDVFRGINTDLQTDEDFADAEKTVKWCGDIEDRLKAAKDHALSQTQSIDELFRAIDSISAEARSKRLELDKLVKARKESLRTEIVFAGRDAVQAHYVTINATLGEHALGVPMSIGTDLNAAIKGKRTITSIRDAVDTAVASEKIAASQKADQVRACIAVLAEYADHQSLFADRVQLCATKTPEDLRNLIAARISEHQAREAKRIEEERARIRAEEEAKARREAEAIAEAERAKIRAEELALANEANARARHEAQYEEDRRRSAPPSDAGRSITCRDYVAPPQPAPSTARIKLSDINARIAPLSITADGLAQLGFHSVGTERAAKLYAESDFPAMCSALVALINRAAIAKATGDAK